MLRYRGREAATHPCATLCPHGLLGSCKRVEVWCMTSRSEGRRLRPDERTVSRTRGSKEEAAVWLTYLGASRREFHWTVPWLDGARNTRHGWGCRLHRR